MRGESRDKLYDMDLSDAVWAIIEPLPPANWLGRSRRLSKDYEYQLQTSEALIDVAAIRVMLNRLAPA